MIKYCKFISLILIIFLSSCTKEKTNFTDVVTAQKRGGFTDVESVKNSEYNIRLRSEDGKLFSGYNPIELKFEALKKEGLKVSSASIIQLTSKDSSVSEKGAFVDNFSFDNEKGIFKGYCIFPKSTEGEMKEWELEIKYTTEKKEYTEVFKLSVKNIGQAQMNRNHTVFKGKDGATYIIALVEPQRPKEGKNKLVAAIYKFDEGKQKYEVVNNHTLKLDPRMPEPSMGNHSSPGNEHLRQGKDGLYYGVVNYTMTGEWTLNFILESSDGNTIEGTSVPKRETPGKWGEKSSLYIDIIF